MEVKIPHLHTRHKSGLLETLFHYIAIQSNLDTASLGKASKTMYSLPLTVLCLLLIGTASGGDYHDADFHEDESFAGADEHNTAGIRRDLKMKKKKAKLFVPSKSGMMMKKSTVFTPAPTTSAAPTTAKATSKSSSNGMMMMGAL